MRLSFPRKITDTADWARRGGVRPLLANAWWIPADLRDVWESGESEPSQAPQSATTDDDDFLLNPIGDPISLIPVAPNPAHDAELLEITF